eukprot:2026543-Amphidinium_carterae.1
MKMTLLIQNIQGDIKSHMMRNYKLSTANFDESCTRVEDYYRNVYIDNSGGQIAGLQKPKKPWKPWWGKQPWKQPWKYGKGKSHRAILIDTGAITSVTSREHFSHIPIKELRHRDPQALTAVTGENIEIYGIKEVTLVHDNMAIPATFIICDVN